MHWMLVWSNLAAEVKLQTRDKHPLQECRAFCGILSRVKTLWVDLQDAPTLTKLQPKEVRAGSKAPYPSMVSSSKGAGLSQTGQVHVGFFSFICRKKTASKHWRWAQVRTRHGTPSRIFTSWKTEWETQEVNFKQAGQHRCSFSPPSASRIYEGVLTGQMRETRRPVVAISLSGSNRSLSWTTGNTHTQRSWSCDIWDQSHNGAADTSVADTYCAHDSVLRSPQSTVWVGWRGLMPWRPSLNRRPPSTAAIRFRGRQQTVINTRSET